YYGLYQYSSVLGGIDAVGNTASGSDYAAYIESDSYPVVLSGNDLSNSREVYLYQDLLAQFTGNDLLNDGFIGFDSNTIGLFDHNDINSTAFSQSGNLIEGGVWSAAYPVGGNYWTGYTGTDRYSGPGQNLSGGDGLGDVPYSLAGATDQYPLEAPWTNPTVTFEESGLPAGTAWSIDLNGVTMTASAGSVIGFPQVNGANTPFTYTATTTAKGYSTASPSGSGTERGSDELISIVFGSGPGGRPVYEVTITETGLPAGLSWSVTLNGTTMSTTATSITFPEGKGTYTYTVTVPSGYSVSPSSGSITVSASNAALAVSVSYAPSPSTGSPAPTSTSSFSNETGYGLVAALGVVVVVALVGWALFARKGRGGASATPPPPWSEGPPGPGSPPPTPTAPPPPAPPTPAGGGSGPAP
ncbi:MAG TPA: hypothetical protein VGS23_05785, partial [Thermoplasmata archaeon]|nr:hypothetical protein [Thermoplasmata archaeon]